MILYENTIENFIKSANERKMISVFADEYSEHFSRKIDSKIKAQWKYIIQVLKELLINAELGEEIGVRVDYVVTNTYKWFEVILAAQNQNENKIMIVEVLPFVSMAAQISEEVYLFETDDGNVEFIHPSLQSICYKEYIKSNLNIVSGTDLSISSVVYMFECDDEKAKKELQKNSESISEVPIFYFGDEYNLIQKLKCFSNLPGGKDVLQLLHSKDQLCSAGMESYIDNLFSDATKNRLFAEQKYVASAVISSVKNNESNFYILNGMAGTGKTTVAISVMKELQEVGYKVLYLNGSLATSESITYNIQRHTDMEFEIKTIQSFVREKEWKEYDAIIVDEAQNIGYFFIHKYMNEVSKLPGTILFLYSMIQCISEKEHDFLDSINIKAKEINVDITTYDLNNNVRFSGQSSGINWLVHQLQIADTGNYEDWDVDTFKIEILDKPNSIYEVIRDENDKGNLCRTIVRYDDIESISKYGEPCVVLENGEFRMPVITANSKDASRWYRDNKLAEYAIGVRLTQGTEMDYACVIINDLTIDLENEIITLKDSVKERAVKRIISRSNGECTDADIENYLKMVLNGYYIAVSRGMKGVYIYCDDEALSKYLSDKVFYAGRRYSWIKDFIKKYDFDSEMGIIQNDNVVSDEKNESNKYAYVTQIYYKFNTLLEGIKVQIKDVMDEKSFKQICDQCSSLLLELQSDTIDDSDIASRYTNAIIENMGNKAWNKLSDLSKKCLLSAEIIFHDLKDYNQIFDFSGVCVQVSKAVEYELSYRFLTKYVEYLQKRFKNNLMQKIPKSLVDEYGNIKTAEIYTLGDVRFTVGMDNEGNVKNNYTYRLFSDYANSQLFINSSNVDAELSEHIRIVHKIKEDYRNKAAHKSSIDVVAAKECIDYVVETERKLGMMLDAYKL